MALETPARGRQVRAAFSSVLGRRFYFFPCASQVKGLMATTGRTGRRCRGAGGATAPGRAMVRRRGDATRCWPLAEVENDDLAGVDGRARPGSLGFRHLPPAGIFPQPRAVSRLGCFGHDIEVPFGTRDGIWTRGFSRRVLGTWMLTSIATIPISTILRFAGSCQDVVFISPSHQEVDIRCRPAPVTHRTQFARRCGAERRRLPMCLHVDAPGFRVDWTPHLPMEFWGCCCCGLGLFPPRCPLPPSPI